MHDFKAIIFDMDGLLVNSEPMWMRADETVIQRRGQTINMAVRATTLGVNTEDSMGIYKDHYGWDEEIDDLVDEIHQVMVDLIFDGLTSLPGAHEILTFVTENDIPRAIASSSVHLLIDSVMDAMGWGDIFELRASSQDVVNGKPAPDVYIHAAKLLGVTPGDCIALEDSPTGAKSASAAGCICYAVPDSSHTSADKFQNITPFVFEDLNSVLVHLAK